MRCYAVDLDSASQKTGFRLKSGACASQGKVKFVADAIWSKLSGVFSKEVLHAQHVSVFCHILQVTVRFQIPQFPLVELATCTIRCTIRCGQGFQTYLCRFRLLSSSVMAQPWTLAEGLRAVQGEVWQGQAPAGLRWRCHISPGVSALPNPR